MSDLAARFASRTLADIAAALPGATTVFRRRKLDFCCGGNVALAEAAAAKGIAVDELAGELEAVAALGLPVQLPVETAALIAHVVDRYHATHRREVPELVRLARRVEAVHRDRPGVPAGLADELERVGGELEQHMQKEEQVLFPLMLRGGHPMIRQPIAVMLAEHEDHGANLRALEALTDDFTPPAHACTTWRALYSGGRKLVDDVMEHIHIENNVLFPRFTG
jgi:regulator of cell morphogenesis and NO signaling